MSISMAIFYMPLVILTIPAIILAVRVSIYILYMYYMTIGFSYNIIVGYNESFLIHEAFLHMVF